MNIPRFSVRNPVAVNLIMAAILIGGFLFCWPRLLREFFPNIESEQILITVAYPGATPEEIERSVTRRIEREIEDVAGVEEIRAEVFEGITLIVGKVDTDADRAQVLEDMRAELDKVKPDLPDGAEEPEIVEQRPFIPAIAVVVHGDVSEESIRAIAEEVQDDLLELPDITELVVTGTREREYQVTIRPDMLEQYGLTFENVGRAIRALNEDIPGGQLKGLTSNVRVRTLGEARSLAALEQKALFTKPDGTVIRLVDIADVVPGFEDVVEQGRFSSKRAVSISVFKTPEQDAIKISDQVKAYVKANEKKLGGAVTLSVTTDLSRFIRQRLDLMSRNAFAGFILLLIALAVFLELRVALWVAVGLLVSFAGTFIMMYAFGASINLISLFGLIVVLGLIVDDAIVIGENIFRRRRQGMDPLAAAEVGAREVTWPVIAAVSTTIAAFLPLMFMDGRIGGFLGVLPVVVICALSVSLVEGFLILPGHLAHGGKPLKKTTGFRATMRRAAEARHRVFEVYIPGALEGLVRFCLRWRYVTVAVVTGLLMGAMGLVMGGIVPFVLLQDTDAETVTAKLEMAAGTPEAETVVTLKAIEELCKAEAEVDTVFAVVGASFNDRGKEIASDPATVGQVTLELVPADKRDVEGMRTSGDLISDLRVATSSFPGVERLSWKSQGGGPQGADVELQLRCDDFDMLRKATIFVSETVSSYDGIEELYDDLQLGKLEARIRLREDARLLGLTSTGLALQLRNALFGFEAQDLQVGTDEITVRVMLPEADRMDLQDLGNIRISLPSGQRVALSEVSTFSTERGYAAVRRVDGKRTATIRAEVNADKANVGDINNDLVEKLKDIDKTYAGVSIRFEGEKKEAKESLSSLKFLYPIALLLIYIIIAMVFRSYVQPLIVMSVIPFSFVGAIGGHALLGYPFTVLSMIGIVALAGIVVNDGLILVDFVNRLRRSGMGVREALVQGTRGRVRAILLTSITTCVGLAPLMLETSFQAQFLIPMAVSIVFGLAFATLLVLVLLPCFYLILEDMRANMRWAWGHKWQRDLPYDPAQHLEDDLVIGDLGA